MGILSQAPLVVGFDAASLARLAALANVAGPMVAAYTGVMNRSVALVLRRAGENAPVVRGTLKRGLRGETLSPWEGRVGVIDSVPYARRREFSFDNQTDSLGRYYPMDPIDPAKRANMHYLERALIATKPDIMEGYSAATSLTLRRAFL